MFSKGSENYPKSVKTISGILYPHEGSCVGCYRGTSLTRNSPPIGPYSSPMSRDLWWS